MGDRASIRFVDGRGSSPKFCDHWAGETLHSAARHFARSLPPPPSNGSGPIDRREAGHLLAAFMETWRGEGSSYLETNGCGVDDSDNGCLVIKFNAKGRPMFDVESRYGHECDEEDWTEPEYILDGGEVREVTRG
jgi:hypothetical protein